MLHRTTGLKNVKTGFKESNSEGVGNLEIDISRQFVEAEVIIESYIGSLDEVPV